MAANSYPLTALDWSDCGAADDCAVQLRGSAEVLVTASATKPAADAEGLVLSPAGDRSASFQKPGLRIWARGWNKPSTIVVER